MTNCGDLFSRNEAHSMLPESMNEVSLIRIGSEIGGASGLIRSLHLHGWESWLQIELAKHFDKLLR